MPPIIRHSILHIAILLAAFVAIWVAGQLHAAYRADERAIYKRGDHF